MAKEKEAPVVPERATQATTRSVMVPLNEFVLEPERYCHRDPAELSDLDRLKSLMNSLIVEGQQTEIEFFKGPNGKKVVTRGHRRVTAMRQLAKQNTPGFTHNMQVKAVEVMNATPKDLLCRSIADNLNRKDFTTGERLRGAKALHDNGVEATRAAYVFGLSVKQYMRDLRIAHYDWMLAHVEKDDIGHTDAGTLLAAAEKAKRVDDVKDHLGKWIEDKKKEIRQRRSREKKDPIKEVKVKGELSKELLNHWIEQLVGGKPLDDKLTTAKEPEVPIAGIDAAAHKVAFNQAEIDLLNISVPDLAKAVATIGSAQKVMVEYLKKRHALEGARGPQDMARQEGQQLDLSVLRSEGLEDLAHALSQLGGTPTHEPQKEGSPPEAKEGQ